MAINGRYSYKSFAGMTFLNVPASEFSNSEIVGACFANQVPGTQVFPDDVVNVTFIKCNLDNITLPANSTLIETTNLRILSVDEVDCVVDENNIKVDGLDEYLKIAFWRDV